MNWIWTKSQEKNTFAEFQRIFEYGGGRAVLRISASYRYAAYINETLVSCGQYADLPTYKSVDEVDLTSFLHKGGNVLRVLAWDVGEDFFVCRSMPPCVAFEIIEEGNCIAQSDERTVCRRATGYSVGEKITPQIGYGYYYDFTKEEERWTACAQLSPDFIEVKRPIPQTTVAPLSLSKIVAQGIFAYREGNTVAEKMQYAWLCSSRFIDMTGKNRLASDKLKEPLSFTGKGGDGVFLIADTGRETCGYLGFTVKVAKPCKMLLCWGEHLSDLRVRSKIGPRNFGIEFTLQAGENVFDDYLMRLGCRYLCVYVESEEVTVSRLGIHEAGYPFSFPERDFGDRLLNAIYETGRRTLYLSAHEHYEDCPWREQALYGMDSRNQMLFGYGAFEEYAYPRANLTLIGKCLREDGQIPLCAPSRLSICIPSFSLYWLIAIGENVEREYNEDFVKEILPAAEKCLNAFLAREEEIGLRQLAEAPYWNFHEWSDGLDGGQIWRSEALSAPKGDCILTALTAIAAEKTAYVQEKVGNFAKAEELRGVAARFKGYLETYYDEEKGLYASYISEGEKEGYHAYTQAIVLLTGAVAKKRQAKLCKALKAPTEYGLVPETFAALQAKYEALVKYGKGLNDCVEEVVRIFGTMLFSGVTSYWETANGEADFVDAGSMCHGWAAVACWLFDSYLKKKTK